MATVRAFSAVRPSPGFAAQVCAPPYDVLDRAEASELARGNPDSFLHVSRPDIDLPIGTDPTAAALYSTGAAALRELIGRGVLRQDAEPSLFVYRASGTIAGVGEVSQIGLVCCTSVTEYENGVIATHEHTRPDKELDRVRHIDALDAQDEPVFLMHRPDPEIARLLGESSRDGHLDEVVSPDGIRHTLWRVAEPDHQARLIRAFAELPRLYVADGHHRSAAAARVARLRREAGKADAESESFLSVVFSSDQLTVLPYFRVARLSGEPRALLGALASAFEVTPSASAVVPRERHVFGMHLTGRWYELRCRPGLVDESDPIARLDVSLLQDHVLAPLLGIEDPRTDPDLAFVGGIRGPSALEDAAGPDGARVAFSLFATSAGEVMDVADRGRAMPPKSTWFEPKLLSGLFAHSLR